jgi:uncharacterized protein YdbL (DUF1318 family)
MLVLAGAVLAGALGWGCVQLRVEAVDPHERLEQQVLAQFDSFSQEVYATGSVRAVDLETGRPEPPPPQTDSKRRALEAQRTREFNRDDIRQFKDSQWVRETNLGLLEIYEEKAGGLKESDPRKRALIEDVVREENESRRALMRRVLETSDVLEGEAGMRDIEAIYAKKMRTEAQPGDWVQDPDGTWQRVAPETTGQ